MAKASLRPIALILLGLPFLAFADDVPVMKDVDVGKLTGKWYPVIVVKTNSNPRPTYAYILEPRNDGGVTMNIQIPVNRACIVKKIVMSKTRPGVFTSPEGKGIIMDTDYKTYLFSHFTIGNTYLLEFYARDKNVSEAVRKKFEVLVKKVRLKPAYHFKLQEKDLCTSPPA